MPNHVLLITCRDQRGIIHRVTGSLLRQGLNIVENSEFVDREAGLFFMRTAVEGEFVHAELLAELCSHLPEDATVELRADTPKRLLLYATREPHCVGDLLLRHASRELNAEILAVVSQYEDLAELTARFGIPFHCVAVGELAREAHEARLLRVTEPYAPDYLVLAKYMRVLTAGFVARFENRILNIHHSFLPAFIGRNPYRQAHERGVKIIGATAHFVNDDLDEGPIIMQGVIPVDHSQNAAQMARAGRDVEKTVLARALNLVLEDRVIVVGRRTVVFV
jgi:formyltetrahydrofolate deformylase